MTLNLYYNILHSHELGVSQYISQYGFSTIPVIAMILFGVSLHPYYMAAICIGSLHVKKSRLEKFILQGLGSSLSFFTTC